MGGYARRSSMANEEVKVAEVIALYCQQHHAPGSGQI